MKKITIAGAGYVGLSNAVLLAQHNQVMLFDINNERVEKIKQFQSPISDELLEEYLAKKSLNLTASTDPKLAYQDAGFVIIATPTDYDPNTNFFDTSSVEKVISDVLEYNQNAIMVIKSTIPVGFTEKAKVNLIPKILFSHRNFCVKEKPYTIIYILAELL